MTDENSSPNEAAIDPQVAARYSDLANETAPPQLDRMVLREARQAADSRNRRFTFLAWVRPAAIAATGILSIALILEFYDAGLLAPPTANIPEVAASTETARDADGGTRSAAETANALRREKAAATVSSKTAAPAADEARMPAPVARDRVQFDGDLPRQCDTAARAVPGTWWLCIESLRSAGFHGAADAELESLRDRYPAFAVPE